MKEILLGVLGLALLCLVRFHGRETRPERIRYSTYRSGGKLAKVERSLTINYQLSIINYQLSTIG
jgi:hypothetical protein